MTVGGSNDTERDFCDTWVVELGQVGCSKIEKRDPQEITDAKVDDHGEFYRIVGSTGGIAFPVVMAIVPALTMLMIGIWFLGSWA